MLAPTFPHGSVHTEIPTWVFTISHVTVMSARPWITGGFGAGDIEIAVLCGVFLGWKLEIYFILISFIIGGAIGITLILMKKKSKTDYMPLGPSLAIGAYVALLMGETLILKLTGLG